MSSDDRSCLLSSFRVMIVILLEPSSTVTDTDITCSVINKPWVQLQSGSLWKPVQASLKKNVRWKPSLLKKARYESELRHCCITRWSSRFKTHHFGIKSYNYEKTKAQLSDKSKLYKSQHFYYNLDFLSDIFMIYRGNIYLFLFFLSRLSFPRFFSSNWRKWVFFA